MVALCGQHYSWLVCFGLISGIRISSLVQELFEEAIVALLTHCTQDGGAVFVLEKEREDIKM